MPHAIAANLELWIFVGVLILLLIASPFILGTGSAQRKMRQRAANLPNRLKATSPVREADEQNPANLRKQTGDSSLPLITAIAARLPNISRLRDRLSRAGLTLTAERYLVYTGILFLFSLLVCYYFMNAQLITSALVAVIFSVGLPHFMVNFRTNRQTKRFLLLFPDALDLIVRGLKAGLPVTESMKMVAAEIEEPVGTVFRTISEKMALGIPLENTLYDTAKKYAITEFDFFVTSIVLQRETGGNLSEILANLSDALRQRTMMRMKIKAMSSEARASMYIIGALPIIVTLALRVISPDYIDVLFTDGRGNLALAGAIAMLGMGVYIMLRMAKFEI